MSGLRQRGNALDINDRGQIAGVYADAQRMGHGYVRDRNGAFTTIDVPGATLTFQVRQHGRRAQRHGA